MLIQSDSALSTTGKLISSDVDNDLLFAAQSGITGTNKFGTFSLGTDGTWTYAMNGAHTEFLKDITYTDSFTAVSTDGTKQVVTVSILGVNDAAVIKGATTGTVTASYSNTSTNTVYAATTEGSLSVTDTDSAATFISQSGTNGMNSYGKFSLTSDGKWTYSMGAQQFDPGLSLTDYFTAKSADGTSKVVAVTIKTPGVATAALSETDAVQTASGNLLAGTYTPIAVGTAGSKGYGTFELSSTGAWTYTMNSAHNEFVKDQIYTDTIDAEAIVGSLTTKTTVTVNIKGTNDAAVISGTNFINLTETDKVLTSTGTLTSTDVDGTANAFRPETLIGTYGSLAMASSGTWTYTSKTAQDQLSAGAKATDITDCP